MQAQVLDENLTAIDDGRRHPNKPRRWEVRKLYDRHHEVIRRCLLGQSNNAIAEELGMSPTQVGNIRNSPLVQRQLEVLRGVRDQQTIDVSRQIKEMAPKSVLLLEQILDGKVGDQVPSLPLRVKVAQDNLDRSGYPRQTFVKSESQSAILTVDVIELIKQSARAKAHGIPLAEG